MNHNKSFPLQAALSRYFCPNDMISTQYTNPASASLYALPSQLQKEKRPRYAEWAWVGWVLRRLKSHKAVRDGSIPVMGI